MVKHILRKVTSAGAALLFAAGILAGCSLDVSTVKGTSESGSARSGGSGKARIYAELVKKDASSDRMQFCLDLGSATISKDQSFNLKITSNRYSAIPGKPVITVRDGTNDYDKWTTSVSTESSGGWYLVNVKVPSDYKYTTSKLGFTFKANFKEGTVIAIKEISIASNFTADAWSTFENKDTVRFSLTPPAAFEVKVDQGGSSEVPGNADDLLKTKSEITSNAISGIDFLTAGPGYDTSKEMTLSWQAPMPYCKVEYGPSSGTRKSKVVEGTKMTSLPFANKQKFYSYNVKLDDLTPNTKYSYRVGYYNNGKMSYTSDQYFKTASGSGNFTCMVVSDLHYGKGEDRHASMAALDKMIANTAKKADSVDFTIFNGDMVDKGYNYEQWIKYNGSNLLKNGMVSFSAGNHEYKPENSSDKRSTKDFFTAMAAVPRVSSDAAPDSDYWFIYNKVLFIVTDSSYISYGYGHGSTAADDQAAWFKNVVKANEGKFDFLVAVRHIPHYKVSDGLSEKTPENKGIVKAYNECGVDFVLTADHHAYNRTYRIYNGSVVSKDDSDVIKDTSRNRGTIYITGPMTQGSSPKVQKLKKSGKYNKVFFADSDSSIGATYGGYLLEVKGSQMTVKLVGSEGSVADTVTVSKRSR